MRRQRALPPEQKRNYHVQVHFNQEEIERLYEVADEGYASLSLTLRVIFERYYTEWQHMNSLERARLWLKT